MSVRRLADESVQPASFAFNRDNAAWAKRKLNDYPEGRQASAVIPLLMRAQEQDGWVTKAAIEHVAEMLDMPLIRVLEVATFYTQFQLAPVGKRANIQVCGTTPCMLRGAEDIINVCKKRISPRPFEVSEDGNLSWEEVECQGACVNAPMVMIFRDSYEDLTAEQMEHIIDKFAEGKGDQVTPGPQIDRIYSAPEGGLTSLLTDPANGAASKAIPLATTNEQEPEEKGSKDSDAIADEAGKPPAMDKPAEPDNLKLISGVGPKIEDILNELGIYKFEQIAKWKKSEREWVDGYLKFKGRIDRDDWVKQAKALAKGGAEEYERVFGKKPR